uniref:Uncharacterized protein n=1 Tax=Glossina austeni TaxID=7395 RepID=A0A1A9UDB1_GLOAU
MDADNAATLILGVFVGLWLFDIVVSRRVKEAQNLRMQTAIEENIDVVLLASYTKAPSATWFEDRDDKATIYRRNAVLLLGKRDEAKENFVMAEVVRWVNYFGPRACCNNHWVKAVSIQNTVRPMKSSTSFGRRLMVGLC